MDSRLARRFPSEIVSEIFLECIDIGEATLPDRAPILLTRVSRWWRAIALSTPHLWSYLRLRTRYADRGIKHLESYFAALQAWLSLSQSLPLSFDLRWGESPENHALVCEMSIAKSLHILCAHCLRWKNVVIDLPLLPYDPTTQLKECRSLPLLETFCYIHNEFSRGDPWDVSFLQRAPRLHQATITYPSLDSWILPWSQLTRLSLIVGNCVYLKFNVDLALETLSHCTNLDDFRFECNTRTPIIRDTSTTALMAELQSLQMSISLYDNSLGEYEGEEMSLLLECLTHLVLPKLRKLRISVQQHRYVWDVSLTEFVAHFADTLECLEMHGCQLPYEVALDMLEHLPNLTTISVSFSTPMYGYDADWSLLKALTLRSTAHCSGQWVINPNPNLMHISIHRSKCSSIFSSNFGVNESPRFNTALSSMIRSRWQARANSHDMAGGAPAPGLTSVSFDVEEMDSAAPDLYACIAQCMEEGLRVSHTDSDAPPYYSSIDIRFDHLIL
ncbi:hypothetical protein EW146_g7375 [Bondarzewia mesenterica]|uniref:F-box domain-containing protein n=1 Tax=Bondarzewia mesenterica TaxID=1095465 RepID=A0A4S4LKY2_9AGAM|nr:hypothetical protein EW146_g7375 [Bondarzewia mesenterica]